MYKLDYQSPIGIIEILSTEEAIYSIMFTDRETVEHIMQPEYPEFLKSCYDQLNEYFLGERVHFTFPYSFEGTVFQRSVWDALTTIPYAETASYKHIAQTIGNVGAVRAVGSANNRNKLSIVIPCHRIISVGGKLTGYAGGLWRKEWLLQHEKSNKKEY